MLDLKYAIDTMPKVAPVTIDMIHANPADVATPDSLIDALWDSYSASAGKCNWERLRSLFFPSTGSNMVIHPVADGRNQLGILHNHEAYRSWCWEMLSVNNLYEWELARQIRRFGNMAHVAAAVEVGDQPNGIPFGQAMQNIQLYWDGRRWWILSILIDIITPENPFPADFLATHASRRK
jgi:hypothetical protein